MTRPRLIVAPYFRRMAEIFSGADLARLHELGDVVWGGDEPMPPEEFAAAVPDAAAIVFGSWTFGPEALDHAGSRLRAILEVAGSHHHPDLDYTWCFENNVAIGSCAPAFGPVVAEMALALTLAATRDIAGGDRAFRAGRERYLHEGCQDATLLFGKTAGFVGCGGLARSLQPLLDPFGVSVLGYDPWLNDEELTDRGIEPVGLEHLVAQSDVIYVLAAPNPTNRKLIDRALMERIRPGSVLVVISRAHLVDFDALTDLVLQGRFRAAIDVFPEEPVPLEHPIRTAENAVLSAHRAGAVPEALHEIGRFVVDDLAAILNGRTPLAMQYATPKLITRFRHPDAPPSSQCAR